MARSGQRKRKSYGVVRDLDEDFLQHRNASENDNTDDNSSDSSVNFSNDGGTGGESDDDYSIEQNGSGNSSDKRRRKETGHERDIGKESEKKVGNRTNRNVATQKNNKNQNKNSPAKSKNGGSGRNASIAIDDDNDGDSDSDSGEANTTTATATAIPGTTPNEKKKPKIALDSFDVVLPSSIIDGGGCSSENQCTLLVEVSDPKDAIALGEFGGSVGAIGRFESDPNGITLDLKGNQYRGSLLPGPTCMVLGFPSSFGFKKKETTTTTTTTSTGAIGGRQAGEGSLSATVGTLRVEGITDEYATLVQIDDHMKKLDAIVTGNQDGIDGDEMNRGDQLKEKIGKNQ